MIPDRGPGAPGAVLGRTWIDSPGFKRTTPEATRRCLTSTMPFIQGDEGGAVEILHVHIEDGAAHRNQRGGRGDIIRIRNAGEMLDIDFNLAHPDIQQVADAVSLAEGDFGVGEDFERAAVGHLEFGVPVGAGFDHLLLLDDAAGRNGDAVSGAVPQLGNIARLNQRPWRRWTCGPEHIARATGSTTPRARPQSAACAWPART